MNSTEEDDSSLCPVCKEHFTDGTKAPACLKCGHVLCRQCAYIIMSQADASGRICPICRSPSTFGDVRIVYIGAVRVANENAGLESENEELRQRLRSTEKEYENSLRTLRWYQKEHLEKCNQRSKMLAYYQKCNGNLYRKMRYYRDSWYRLKSNFEKLKSQRNRMTSELAFLKSRHKYARHGRGGAFAPQKRYPTGLWSSVM